MWTNVGAVSCFYLFSFTFIFPYRGDLMIPCIVFFCLSIYLSLVHLNISLCRIYNYEDTNYLINFFEKISQVSLYIKKGKHYIPYKECIDFSGSLNLENNRLYNLKFNGIEIYYNIKKNYISSVEIKDKLSFDGNNFISHFFNIWMFIHIFTLTSWLYSLYLKCNIKNVSFKFKKILLLDDNDFTLSEKNFYKSIGLNIKFGDKLLNMKMYLNSLSMI